MILNMKWRSSSFHPSSRVPECHGKGKLEGPICALSSSCYVLIEHLLQLT